MRQTTLSVVLEVEPASAGRLSTLIEKLKRDEDRYRPGDKERYSRLKKGVPSLHFMSMSVFHDAHYDPIFVIEANFDGRPGPFWAQFEAVYDQYLRPMLRCCKRPGDDTARLYDAVTRPDSRYPVAPYLEARTLRPSVFHHGNRGLERGRVEREGKLFLATRKELAQADPAAVNPYRMMTAQQIHATLREALKPAFPWLDEAAPVRISAAERATDLLKVAGLLLVILGCLSVPGIVVAVIAPWQRFLVLFACFTAVVYLLLYRMRAPLHGQAAPAPSGGLTLASLSMKNKLTSFAHPATFSLVVLGVLAFYLIVATAIGTMLAVPITGGSFGDLWRPTLRIVTLGLVSALLFTVPALVLWLRWLERRDSSHDAPPVQQDLLRQMQRREDRVAQNHMGSVVLVKPGILRMALFRTGHLALGWVLRVIATDGYLGSMRTVHFAHWAFISNGSRLMFFSNFDHSWDSYLDDFIEKAHGGLTLSWGSGVGFPPARFLVLDGASHGRRFKAWARHSMAVSRFWFSAYPNYTVDQIERHVRIATGLRKGSLTPKEAVVWARDL